MTRAFKDRPINELELHRLRLILSTFRDGSGQQISGVGVMPGFRDYERALAAVLGGYTPENKGVFDVVVPTNEASGDIGISCKMAKIPPARHQCSFMELSNSAAAWRNYLVDVQINWATEPGLAGPAVIDLVTSWHTAVADGIDMDASSYSVLAHNSRWTSFELLCFPLNLRLANPRGDVEWRREGQALNGYVDVGSRLHRLWQCYFNSGGQLKYYPPLDWARWRTEPFSLEQPPAESLQDRAREYFPTLWR